MLSSIGLVFDFLLRKPKGWPRPSLDHVVWAPDLIVHGQAKLDEEEKARVLAEASIIHSLVHHFSFP